MDQVRIVTDKVLVGLIDSVPTDTVLGTDLAQIVPCNDGVRIRTATRSVALGDIQDKVG